MSSETLQQPQPVQPLSLKPHVLNPKPSGLPDTRGSDAPEDREAWHARHAW